MAIRFAIAIYRCEVDGKRTDSLDIPLRYFGRATADIESFLKSEPVHSYRNSQNYNVAWHFVRVAAEEELIASEDGQEIVGLTAGCDEFVGWARHES